MQHRKGNSERGQKMSRKEERASLEGGGIRSGEKWAQ
jgi:hypothetical protein